MSAVQVRQNRRGTTDLDAPPAGGGLFSSKDGLRDVLLSDEVPYRRGGEVAISDWHSGGYRMVVGKARTVFCAEGGK